VHLTEPQKQRQPILNKKCFDDLIEVMRTGNNSNTQPRTKITNTKDETYKSMSIKNRQQKIKITERKNKTPSLKKQVTKNHNKVRRGGEVIAF